MSPEVIDATARGTQPAIRHPASGGRRRQRLRAWLWSVRARIRGAALRQAIQFACILRGGLRGLGDRLVPAELLVSEVATGALDAQVARCLCELRIASTLVAHGRQTTDELSRRLSLPPSRLHRLLHFAATRGLLKQDRRGAFVANRCTRQLDEQAAQSTAAFVRYFTAPGAQQAVAQLVDVLRTEQDAYVLAHQQDVWSYFAEHVDEAAHFDQAMVAMSSRDADDTAALLGPERSRHFCDIGGGCGTVTAAVLQRFVDARASLLDRAEVLPASRSYLQEKAVLPRARLVPGNFFDAMPIDGTCYLLRNILHDWNDVDAGRLLRHCRQKMPIDATLAIVETLLVPRRGFAELTHRMDMVMMIGTVHGRQRSPSQLNELLEQAGFRVTKRLKLPSSCDLWLCQPHA